MESRKLAEIKNTLSMLPELKNRLKRLDERIYDAEQRVQELLLSLEKESYDVEKLKKDSLSVTLLKLVGIYEGRLDKEMQEEYAAKVNYDKAAGSVTELRKEREEIWSRISKLEDDRAMYEKELEHREKLLMDNINDEAAIKYRQLEAEREVLAKQLLETNEALRAARRVESSASEAIDHLESAEDWATYDAWTRGGLFSHMAKYDHIDNAQEGVNRLAVQLKELQKELSDVNLFENLEITEIDSTTRVFDIWFDNIFTDLSVRDKIRDDMEQLERLRSQIGSIMNKLKNNEHSINNKLEDIENKKKDLLIN